MKIHIFKDVIPCQPVYTRRCSGGECYLRLQVWRLFTNQHGITFQKTCVIFYVVFSFKHLNIHVLYKTVTIHITAPHTVCHHINPLNAELNPICHLVALLGADLIFHISRIRVKKMIFYNFCNTQVWLFERLLLQKNITFSEQSNNNNIKEKYFIITKRHTFVQIK